MAEKVWGPGTRQLMTEFCQALGLKRVTDIDISYNFDDDVLTIWSRSICDGQGIERVLGEIKTGRLVYVEDKEQFDG